MREGEKVKVIDVIKDVVEYITNMGYDELDLSDYEREIDENIEEVLKGANFKFEKRGEGIYFFEPRNNLQEKRKLVEYIISKLEKGPDEDGDILIDTFKFGVDQYEVVALIKDLGYDYKFTEIPCLYYVLERE